MARQAFGGYVKSPGDIKQNLSTGETQTGGVDTGDTVEEAGTRKAREIWERMRIGSEGSAASIDSLVHHSRACEESEDEEERVRECKVIGTPWLT